MDSETLDAMLKVLRDNKVSHFRTKNGEDSFLEIVFKDDVVVMEDQEEEVKAPKPYGGTNIGLKFESFDKPASE